MKNRLKIKNNFKLIGSIVLIAFVLVVFFTERKRASNHSDIKKRGKKTIAVTIGCDKNIRSALHTLHYKFTYKDSAYYGIKDFDIEKRGNVCVGLLFFNPFRSC